MKNIPFRPSRRKRDWLNDEDIAAAMERAAAAQDNGDTAAAVKILIGLREEAVKSFGIGHHKLAPIDDALNRLATD